MLPPSSLYPYETAALESSKILQKIHNVNALFKTHIGQGQPGAPRKSQNRRIKIIIYNHIPYLQLNTANQIKSRETTIFIYHEMERT